MSGRNITAPSIGIKFLFKSGTRSRFNFEKLKIIKTIDRTLTNVFNFMKYYF